MINGRSVSSRSVASVCTRYPYFIGDDFVFTAAAALTGDLALTVFYVFAFDAAAGLVAPFDGEFFTVAFFVGDGVALIGFVGVTKAFVGDAKAFVGDAVAAFVVDGFSGEDTACVVVFYGDAVTVAIFAYSAAAFLSFS